MSRVCVVTPATATTTFITTITSTGWRTTFVRNRGSHCSKAATCATRWAAASRKSQRERERLTGKEYLWLNPTPEVTWYGWDGDKLTTTQTDKNRVQTVYQPGSFTPLLRVETAMEELTKSVRRTLAEKLQQDAGMVFVPELVTQLDNLERELSTDLVSAQSQQWLAQCGLTPEQMKNQMEPEYTPMRKIHLYHCDHRGLPLALVNADGTIAWSAEFDE